RIEVREFVPPAEAAGDVDLKGRPMYAVPWAIADPDAVVAAMDEYIDRAIVRYMEEYLDHSDPLVWNVFQMAYRSSVFPVPVGLTQPHMCFLHLLTTPERDAQKNAASLGRQS